MNTNRQTGLFVYTSAANAYNGGTTIGMPLSSRETNDVLFVVYTDRVRVEQDGKEIDVTRLISARLATEFERGMYCGKY